MFLRGKKESDLIEFASFVLHFSSLRLLIGLEHLLFQIDVVFILKWSGDRILNMPTPRLALHRGDERQLARLKRQG